jgi:hypoxanthine-DNA glycosylase
VTEAVKGRRLKGLAPVVDARSRVLILGSFPGPMSLAKREYYAYPQNQFWKIISDITGAKAPSSYARKISSLRRGGLALWDVIYSCRRHDASDTSISDPVYNDIRGLIKRYPGIKKIFCNGGKSYAVCTARLGDPGIPVVRLPSTSPANASLSYARKLREWRKISRRCR